MEPSGRYETAVLAGGCFWCLQPVFDKLPGVISTEVGYTGGNVPHPTYEEVCEGRTGHLEAIRVVFDPSKVSYDGILEAFWRTIDPTQSDGQFADRGPQYRTAIFFLTDRQREAADKSVRTLAASGKFRAPIVTAVRPAGEFYPAEACHQAYYRKNTGHYEVYKEGSGRGPFLRRMWGEQTGPSNKQEY